VSYAIIGGGSVYHLLGKWIENRAGIEMVAVPYRGSVAAFTDVVGGRLDVMIDTATSAIPRIRNGQLRPLAVSSPERYALMPDTPTMAETVPGIQLMSWLGGGCAADSASHHRSAQRRIAAHSRTARRQAVAGGYRRAGRAVLARGAATADRNRDRALRQDRGGERHQGRVAPQRWSGEHR
jgi:hypothetical protein